MWLELVLPICKQLKHCGSARFPPLTLLLEYASQNRQKRTKPPAPPILSRLIKRCYTLVAPGGLPESEYDFIGLSVGPPSGYRMKARTSPSTKQGGPK